MSGVGAGDFEREVIVGKNQTRIQTIRVDAPIEALWPAVRIERELEVIEIVLGGIFAGNFQIEVEHLVEANHRLTGHDIIERDAGLDHRRDRVETINERPHHLRRPIFDFQHKIVRLPGRS